MAGRVPGKQGRRTWISGSPRRRVECSHLLASVPATVPSGLGETGLSHSLPDSLPAARGASRNLRTFGGGLFGTVFPVSISVLQRFGSRNPPLTVSGCRTRFRPDFRRVLVPESPHPPLGGSRDERVSHPHV